MINPKNEILKIIETLSYTRRGEDIFRDWCSMFASSIQNSCRFIHSPEWEKTDKVRDSNNNLVSAYPIDIIELMHQYLTSKDNGNYYFRMLSDYMK